MTLQQLAARATWRAALCGIHGGTGRTTAITMLARSLAEQGYTVLVVDADFESPAATELLSSPADAPTFGLADWMARTDTADPVPVPVVGARYPRAEGGGDVWIAPAYGCATTLDNLARPHQQWATVADAAEQSLTARGHRPDVVLLDCPAGLATTTAVAESDLFDQVLLFTTDTAVTWRCYEGLFTGWAATGRAVQMREKLRVVAPMVSSNSTPQDTFREHLYDRFTLLYDDVPADNPLPGSGDPGSGPYSPSLHDEHAPHHPIPILLATGLIRADLEPSLRWQDYNFIRVCFENFIHVTASSILDHDIERPASHLR